MSTVRSFPDLSQDADRHDVYPNPSSSSNQGDAAMITVANSASSDDNGEENVGKLSSAWNWLTAKFSRNQQHHLVPGAQAPSAPSYTRTVLSDAIKTGNVTKASVVTTNTAGISICLAAGYITDQVSQQLPDLLVSMGVDAKDGVFADADVAANVVDMQTKLDKISQAGLLGGQLFLFLNTAPSLLNSLTHWKGIRTGSTCYTLLTNLDLEVGKLLQAGGLLLTGVGVKDQLDGNSIKGAIETTTGLVAATIGTGMVNINRARVNVRNNMFIKQNLVYTAQSSDEPSSLVGGMGPQ